MCYCKCIVEQIEEINMCRINPRVDFAFSEKSKGKQ